MSTVAIVVIVAVVVIILVAFMLVAPRARENARIKRRERELDQRRDKVVTGHRQEAAERERKAELAEQRARVADQEAQRDRAEVREEKATLHERGLADQDLIDEDEREHFAGTSAVADSDEQESEVGSRRVD